MRQRLPLILSATALAIAVLGSTSLGQAAGNAAGQTVRKAKAGVGLAPSAATPRRGPRGPRGLRGLRGPVGPAGAAGAPGAPGTAIAYAHINSDGSVDATNSKNVGSTNVAHPGTGVYCLSGLSSAPKNVVGNVGSVGVALSLDVTLSAISGCGAGTQVTIRTFDGGGSFTNNDHWININ